MTGKQAVAAVGRASQAALSRRRGTSNAKARAKVEAGRSRKAMSRKAQVLRTRMVLVGCNRIRVAYSLGTAASVAKWCRKAQHTTITPGAGVGLHHTRRVAARLRVQAQVLAVCKVGAAHSLAALASVLGYTTAFRRCLLQCPTVTKDKALHRYVRGLRDAPRK